MVKKLTASGPDEALNERVGAECIKNGFTPEQINAPETVPGVTEEGQPRWRTALGSGRYCAARTRRTLLLHEQTVGNNGLRATGHRELGGIRQEVGEKYQQILHGGGGSATWFP